MFPRSTLDRDSGEDRQVRKNPAPHVSCVPEEKETRSMWQRSAEKSQQPPICNPQSPPFAFIFRWTPLFDLRHGARPPRAPDATQTLLTSNIATSRSDRTTDGVLVHTKEETERSLQLTGGPMLCRKKKFISRCIVLLEVSLVSLDPRRVDGKK